MDFYRLSALTIMAALCTACESDGNSYGLDQTAEKTHLSSQNSNEGAEEGNASSSSPVEVHAVRELDIAGDSVVVTERSSYHSLHRYGDTQKLFHFENENAVLQITFSNKSDSFESSATVYIFEAGIADDKVAKWVNNQVPDAIYADAPEPIFTYELDGHDYQITGHSAVGQFTGEYGDEYQGYTVDIYIGNAAKDSIFYLTSFVTDAEVYVQTKDIDQALVP